MNQIESILQQSPLDIDQEYIEKLLIKYDGNVADVLSDVWKVADTGSRTTSNIAIDKVESAMKWNNIRGICDAYEGEMRVFMEQKHK